MVRTDQEILALGQARDQEAIAAMARSTAPTATPWPATCWATTPTRRSASTTPTWRCGTPSPGPSPRTCWPT